MSLISIKCPHCGLPVDNSDGTGVWCDIPVNAVPLEVPEDPDLWFKELKPVAFVPKVPEPRKRPRRVANIGIGLVVMIVVVSWARFFWVMEKPVKPPDPEDRLIEAIERHAQFFDKAIKRREARLPILERDEKIIAEQGAIVAATESWDEAMEAVNKICDVIESEGTEPSPFEEQLLAAEKLCSVRYKAGQLK